MLIDSHGVAEVNFLKRFTGRGRTKPLFPQKEFGT